MLSFRLFDKFDDVLDFANCCLFVLFVRDEHLAKVFELAEFFVEGRFFLEKSAELWQFGELFDEATVGVLAELSAKLPIGVVQKVRECVDRCVELLNVLEKFLSNLLNESSLLVDVLPEVLGSVDLDDTGGSDKVHFDFLFLSVA